MVTGGLRTIELSRANIGDLAAGDSAVLYTRQGARKNRLCKLHSPQDRQSGHTSKRSRTYRTSNPYSPAQATTTRGAGYYKNDQRIIKRRLNEAGHNSDRLTRSLRAAGTLNLLNGEAWKKPSSY